MNGVGQPATELEETIFNALAQMPSARASLIEISSYEACTPKIRRQFMRLINKFDDRHFFRQNDADDFEAVLREIGHWINEGTFKVWVIDECYASGGWYDLFQPSQIIELDHNYKEVQKLHRAVNHVKNVLKSQEIAERLLA